VAMLPALLVTAAETIAAVNSGRRQAALIATTKATAQLVAAITFWTRGCVLQRQQQRR
jgi:hypothetical protein